MGRVVSLFLPYWSTDQLRRKTRAQQPDQAAEPQPLVTAVLEHAAASSLRRTRPLARWESSRA